MNQQINSNRYARHQLELDLNNKDSALNIDHSARGFHNNSRCGHAGHVRRVTRGLRDT